MCNELDSWKRKFDSEKHAAVYDEIIDLFSLRRRERLKVLTTLLPDLNSPDPVILELGAGTGVVTELLAGHYPTGVVVAVDGAENMMQQARSRPRLKDNGLIVRWVLADYSSREWIKGLNTPVDLVVAVDALHHLPHERYVALYQEIYDLMAGGARFLMTDHVETKGPFHDEPQYLLWMQEVLDNLKGVEKGSAVAEVLEKRFSWTYEDLQNLTLSKVRDFFTAALIKEGDNPMPLMQHIDALRTVGFADVELEYRFANYALISCAK